MSCQLHRVNRDEEEKMEEEVLLSYMVFTVQSNAKAISGQNTNLQIIVIMIIILIIQKN